MEAWTIDKEVIKLLQVVMEAVMAGVEVPGSLTEKAKECLAKVCERSIIALVYGFFKVAKMYCT